MLRNSLVILSLQLRPLGKLVLCAGGVELGFQAEHFFPQFAELREVGGCAACGEGCIEGPQLFNDQDRQALAL